MKRSNRSAEEVPRKTPHVMVSFRSMQLYDLVHHYRDLLQNQKGTSKRAVLRQTVEFLRTHPDYPKCWDLKLDNDFAWLPNEIINDVVAFGQDVDERFNEPKVHEELAKINGSWANFAKLQIADYPLRYTELYAESEDQFEELKTNAPQFYGEIKLESPEEYFDFCILELVGTRFSNVTFDNSIPSDELEDLQAINFLKRQLKSKYLRKLTLKAEFETKELNQLFVEFVKRPHCEKLTIDRWFSSGADLPLEVFVEARKTWEATQHFEVPYKLVCSLIPEQSLEKLQNDLKIKIECIDFEPGFSEWTPLVLNHPVHSSAKMKITICYTELDDLSVSMEFFDLQSDSE